MKGRIEERIFLGLMYLSVALVSISLVLILGVILFKGAGSLSLDMITKVPEGGYYFGKGGGVLNAIAGSLVISVAATILAFCLSLPIALFIHTYLREGSRRAVILRFCFDLLSGIPSIVYGAFGFTLMIILHLRASALAGIITVALLIMPIMMRGMDEVLRMVPRELRETSLALGATGFETGLRVLLRKCAGGFLTAVLIAFGRGIGDAPSVLFTAGYTDSLPTGLLEPAATLPLAIFFQIGTPFPAVRGRAYASAFVLTLIILAISIITRRLVSREKGQT